MLKTDMVEKALLRALLTASKHDHNKIIKSLLYAVSEVIPFKTCSLWKLNHIAKAVSVSAREVYDNVSGGARAINEPGPPRDDFVHPIEGSMLGEVLKQISTRGLAYFDDDISQPQYFDHHYSKGRVLSLGLKRLISIPIPTFDGAKAADEGHVLAILNIYLRDEQFHFNDTLAQIIKDHFSLTFSRMRLIVREHLTQEIVRIYEKKGSRDLASVLEPIITTVFRQYFDYEGCSVFVWDPADSKLALAQTTGMAPGHARSQAYYYIGQAVTGTIARDKDIVCIPDINCVNDPQLSELFREEHQHLEKTVHAPMSYLGIPIRSPARPEEIVGVIRFTNRLNALERVVDYFSDEDIELVRHACNLVALYMEYEQNEKTRAAFARQMAHELLAPASAIRSTSERLLRKWDAPAFPAAKVSDYLQTILHNAELQIALTKSVQYAWKGYGLSKRQRYQVEQYSIERVIQRSKKIVIPLAREEDLVFDNISIKGKFPTLFIDRYAFEQVFFNLLTNAIKYRKLGVGEKFRIAIDGFGYGSHKLPRHAHHEVRKAEQFDGYLITVSDFGIGVGDADQEKIFWLGYRKKGLEKTNVRGLGIGLTVAKSILEDFGCRIWLSRSHDPTTFSIVLPDKLSSLAYTEESLWTQY